MHYPLQSCLDLVRSNHCMDKTCELPHTDSITHTFLLRCTTTLILSSLYIHPMNMYYDLYLMDTDVSNFTTVSYQAEIILRLATKHDMGWYARNMVELQPLNRTIGLIGTARRYISHQVTSLKQQLCKNTNTRAHTQRLHHTRLNTSFAATAVTDTMKIYPFYDTTHEQHQTHLHCDEIHMLIHCLK